MRLAFLLLGWRKGMVTLQGLYILLTKTSLLSPRPPTSRSLALLLTKSSWPISLPWRWGGGLQRRRVGPPQSLHSLAGAFGFAGRYTWSFQPHCFLWLYRPHLFASPTPLRDLASLLPPGTPQPPDPAWSTPGSSAWTLPSFLTTARVPS